ESISDLGLDAGAPAGPIEGCGVDRGGVRYVDLVELASHVRPAGRFLDPLAIKSVEPRIGIGLQHSGKGRQMGLGSLALAVGRVAEEQRGWVGAGRGSISARVRAQPPLLGGAPSWTEHRHPLVLSMV